MPVYIEKINGDANRPTDRVNIEHIGIYRQRFAIFCVLFTSLYSEAVYQRGQISSMHTLLYN